MYEIKPDKMLKTDKLIRFCDEKRRIINADLRERKELVRRRKTKDNFSKSPSKKPPTSLVG